VKKAQFNKNFFAAWQTVLSPKGQKAHVIQDLTKCDFSLIRQFLDARRDKKKERTKEEKKAEKEEKEKMRAKYGYAVVDGRKEKIANYMVEPPGLFLGRGAHPKTGMLKPRVQVVDVVPCFFWGFLSWLSVCSPRM
jgi:DNA topoisomerase-1